jgi:muconolactone D-isomerase
LLYHVRMDVYVPHDMATDRFELLKAEERARAQDMQHQGKWRHLWRVAGQYSNISSILDDVDDLRLRVGLAHAARPEASNKVGDCTEKGGY